MSALIKQNGMPRQDTEETRAYKAFFKHLQKVMRGACSDEEKSEWAGENEVFRDMANAVERGLSPASVHVSEVISTMSVMYANDELIGDQLFPVIFGTKGKLTAKYFAYDKRDRSAYPDDTMVDEGDPNELSQNRSLADVSLTIRSLRELVGQYTIQNQDAPLNELLDAAQNVLYGLKFRRELRVVTAATTSGNFGSNTTAIAAGDRWDTATGGDPAGVVDTARAAVWSGNGPGVWVGAMSLSVYNVLKRHPRILDTFKYGVGGAGPKFATLQMLAEYFELDRVIVGRARKDTANIGQTASYSRMWPDIFGIYRVSTTPTIRNASFGYTFQDAPTQSDQHFLDHKGAKGVYQMRSTHADEQKIVSADSGYLITTPIG